MATLSSSIVKRNRVHEDVEEALARQVLYGGDLATNLLELAAVSEAELTRLLAESHSLVPDRSASCRAPGRTLRAVAGRRRSQPRAYPLRRARGTLVIAVVRSRCHAKSSRISGSLWASASIQRAAPLVRIRQAIARDYELPLDRRTLRLLAKLEGRPDPSPSSMPGPLRSPTEIPPLPRPPSIPPMAYPPDAGGAARPKADSEPPGTARSGRHVAAETPPPESPLPTSPTPRSPVAHPPTEAPPTSVNLAGWPGRRAPRAPTPRPSARTVHRGDGGTRPARRRVPRRRAEGVFRLCGAVLRVRRAFRRARRHRRRPRRARPRRRPRRIAGIGVPLDLPGALSAARREGTWQLCGSPSDGIDAVASQGSRPQDRAVVLLLPILVRGRCVLIHVRRPRRSNVELSDVGTSSRSRRSSPARSSA